jgi:hypothetical protein
VRPRREEADADADADVDAAGGGASEEGLEGREWEREMGLEEEERRRRGPKERDGRLGRTPTLPRWWQVSGEAAVEDAMAAVSAGGEGVVGLGREGGGWWD